jgi:hypothetical protein
MGENNGITLFLQLLYLGNHTSIIPQFPCPYPPTARFYSGDYPTIMPPFSAVTETVEPGG